MPEAADIQALLKDVAAGGGRVELSGAKLVIDLGDYAGPVGIAGELERRRREVAGYLAAQRPGRVLPSATAVTARAGPAALSSAQRQWADTSLNSLEDQWMPIIWKLEGLLKLEAFRTSCRKLIERHAILRTRYVRTDDAVLQEVMSAHAVEIPEIDLSQLPEPEREVEIWRRLKAWRESPSPLNQGVLHLSLFKLADRQHILAGFVHHIALDGSSLVIFLGELMARYYGGLFGKETGEEPARPYGDFAAWENSWLTPDERKLSYCFWDHELREARPLGFADKPKGNPAEFGVQPLVVPRETFDAMARCAKANGVTPNILFLTALALVLAEHDRSDRAVFGHIAQGRPPGFDKVIGCFIQMRPFFLSASSSASFDELLKRGRRQFGLSSDFRRPVSRELMSRLGVTNVVVNYSRREAPERAGRRESHSRAQALPASQKVFGAFTTTSVRPAPAALERKAGKPVPAFFNAAAPLTGSDAFSQPAGAGLSVRRRVVGGPGPVSFAGLSASMVRLPYPLQTEFHRSLHFAMVQTPAALGGIVTFASNILSPAQASALTDRLVQILDMASRSPQATLGTLLYRDGRAARA